MTKLHAVREARPKTRTTKLTLAERVAIVRAFVDAQRVRKDYKPGWF